MDGQKPTMVYKDDVNGAVKLRPKIDDLIKKLNETVESVNKNSVIVETSQELMVREFIIKEREHTAKMVIYCLGVVLLISCLLILWKTYHDVTTWHLVTKFLDALGK